jgi:hypothetical protein
MIEHIEFIPETLADIHTIRMIAHACHERNRMYCMLRGEENVAPVWEEYSEENRAVTENGVKFTLKKLRENELRPYPHTMNDLIPIQARDNHENWLRDKLDSGWVYGNIKSFDKKTHPCMVPYDQLPQSQKIKDMLFISEVAHHYLSLTADTYAAQASIMRGEG